MAKVKTELLEAVIASLHVGHGLGDGGTHCGLGRLGLCATHDGRRLRRSFRWVLMKRSEDPDWRVGWQACGCVKEGPVECQQLVFAKLHCLLQQVELGQTKSQGRAMKGLEANELV